MKSLIIRALIFDLVVLLILIKKNSDAGIYRNSIQDIKENKRWNKKIKRNGWVYIYA